MARGWESKAVEAQIESSESDSQRQRSEKSAGIEREHARKSLLLSRTRILRDIENCQNPRYKKLLTDALADLDQKLSDLK
ncbi:MAG: hypothetical protein ACREDR_11910 [Blastocatellia bacterium]